MRLVLIGLLALSGLLCGADLNDSYKALKEAVDKKDYPKIKELSGETAKEAKELAKEKQPAEAGEADAWKGRQQFAKEAQDYAEYALAVSAAQATEPAVTMDLTEALIAQNPKSEQLDTAAPAYLAAAGKQGKGVAAANKILVGRPDQEDALYLVASNSLSSSPAQALSASNRLITTMSRKKKPEGMSESDWEHRKAAMLGAGYTFAGVVQGSQNRFADADRNLKAALPLIAGNSTMLSYAYYYLGVANYSMGKLTADKSKMATGVQYTEKAVATSGPMQAQASNNVAIMKREMAGGR